MQSKNKYDVLIPTTFKDYVTLEFCIDGILNYLNPQPENIFVIYPQNSKVDIVKNSKINYINEEEVLNFNLPLDPKRQRWVYQQFIKLFQNVTYNNDYLVIDSDLVLLKDFNVFNDNRRQFFVTERSHYSPKDRYHQFLKHVFDLRSWCRYNFVTEIMLMNKDMCKEILNYKFDSVREFWDYYFEYVVHDPKHNMTIGDYELYGNYVFFNHPDLYDIRKVMSKRRRKRGDIWSKDEIIHIMNKHKIKFEYFVFNITIKHTDKYNKIRNKWL